VVTTHLHPEHTTGELAFPNAKIIRAAAEQKDIDESGMHWVNIFRKRSPERAEILKDAAFRKADELFEKEKTVDLGGVRVRLMYVGPAHTLGDTAFYVEEDKVLFPGDLAMKEIFPAFAMPQSSMRSWLASLEMLERLKPAHVIGSHGDLADGSILAANRERFAREMSAQLGFPVTAAASAEAAVKDKAVVAAASSNTSREPICNHVQNRRHRQYPARHRRRLCRRPHTVRPSGALHRV
ncbi:MAG: MBL fold metallo-hydrolase, partial [Betaproteobacteria bacterium]|nr:MBL fold metallo-hydrolase [Betaproteobacteria bacterium]